MGHGEFRWGIIGPGRIAHKFAQALEVVDGAVVHAVASSDLARAQAFADQYGASEAGDSYAAVADSVDVDAVYIATTHNFHHEQARMVLEAGKPLLCEKPLTVNARQAHDLIDLSRKNNVFLMEALWTRYLPIYAQVREWLADGVIGEVLFMHSTFGFKFPFDPEGRLWNPGLAGGALLDLGVYNIAISQWIMGADPHSFTADGLVGDTGVDEFDAVHLHFDNDVISQFTCTCRARLANDFRISGRDGAIYMHDMFWDCTAATLVTENGAREQVVEKPFLKNGFEYEIMEVQRCVTAGLIESPEMTHADTLANMELMDAIREEIGLRYSFE